METAHHLPMLAYLALALLAALAAHGIAAKLRVPTVTCFVIVGALLGGSILGESEFRDVFLFSPSPKNAPGIRKQ